MSVFVPIPLRPPPLSTKYRRRRHPPASQPHDKHRVSRETHAPHTPRSRRPLCCRTSHSCRLAPPLTANAVRTSSPSAQHPTAAPPSAQPRRSPAPPAPQAPNRSAAVGPTPKPQHPNPQHLSTYALSSFPALDATNVAELELRAPGCNQPTSAYERNHRD